MYYIIFGLFMEQAFPPSPTCLLLDRLNQEIGKWEKNIYQTAL